MCPFPNSSFISNSLLASELVFSLLCLLFSFMIWVLVFNLTNFKQLLLQIEAKNTDLQKAIRELERKLEIQKLSPQEILLNPSTIIKLIEIILLFQSKKLSKLLFLKTLFK